MRVLIAWIYTSTKSVLLAQLMRVSSTGSLVLFSAARVTAGQEAMWFALYGTVLWVVVGIVVQTFGRRLGGTESRSTSRLTFGGSAAFHRNRSIPGNKGAYALRRIEGDTAHFLMLTFWEGHRLTRRQLKTVSWRRNKPQRLAGGEQRPRYPGRGFCQTFCYFSKCI
jgi:hypothetical protein